MACPSVLGCGAQENVRRLFADCYWGHCSFLCIGVDRNFYRSDSSPAPRMEGVENHSIVTTDIVGHSLVLLDGYEDASTRHSDPGHAGSAGVYQTAWPKRLDATYRRS